MSLPDIRAVWDDQILDIASAVQKARDGTKEAFLRSFVLIPLETHDFTRLHLINDFRRALQLDPKRQPNNLISIVRSAKNLDEGTIEARIFQTGGTRAVVAYALAARNNRKVVEWIKTLEDDVLVSVLKSTETIEAHKDVLRMIHMADYNKDQKDHRPTRKNFVQGPRDWTSRKRKRSPSQDKWEDRVEKCPQPPTKYRTDTPRLPEEGFQVSSSQEERTNSSGPDPNTLPFPLEPSTSAENQLKHKHWDDGDQHERQKASYRDEWAEGHSMDSTELASALPVNFVDAETMMMENFDEPLGFVENTGTIQGLHSFDAVHIMSMGFDMWPPER
ncbi:hypothetical protein B0T10DRAFT_463518 [Thelonectria olida]|uniref:Uncharacterized protein n=1 Tax=Thelonectria olida TaxID=1576542 RepID=A0A9P8VXQ7_9HYPO|nr:hypothetical protein B0T10DRAFT_463518 [Thelonectria olida]